METIKIGVSLSFPLFQELVQRQFRCELELISRNLTVEATQQVHKDIILTLNSNPEYYRELYTLLEHEFALGRRPLLLTRDFCESEETELELTEDSECSDMQKRVKSITIDEPRVYVEIIKGLDALLEFVQRLVPQNQVETIRRAFYDHSMLVKDSFTLKHHELNQLQTVALKQED